MNEEKKKEFIHLFTKDATEIACRPERRLVGDPEKALAWIESLLKEQRGICVENILTGFGVGTIEDYQVSIIRNNGLNATEPTGGKK